MMVGWPENSHESLSKELEAAGHTVSKASSTGSALPELLEREFDILVSRACCSEVRQLMSMSRSIRPNCRRVVATLWGRLLEDSTTKLCDADYLLSDGFSADELIAALDYEHESLG